jgi:hypothetical protein
MNKKPLDEETYLRVHSAIDLAEVRGLDPAELLHTRGLLASDAMFRQVKVDAMREVHKALASWRPAELLRRKFQTSHPTSPKDMYDVILEFIDQLIREEM